MLACNACAYNSDVELVIQLIYIGRLYYRFNKERKPFTGQLILQPASDVPHRHIIYLDALGRHSTNLKSNSETDLKSSYPPPQASSMLLPIDYVRSLSPAGVFIGLVALLVIWYIVSAVAAWYRLRHIPGPFLASFSYLWLSKSIIFNTLVGDLRGLTRYGGLARVGPNSILTTDPDVLRRVASARTKYTKDEWYQAVSFSPHHVTMVTLLDNPSHDRVKAKTSSGYNGREISDCM